MEKDFIRECRRAFHKFSASPSHEGYGTAMLEIGLLRSRNRFVRFATAHPRARRRCG